MLLGGLFATVVTSLLLAVPVFSGAGEGVTPAAKGGPSSSVATESARGKSPVVMGVDGSRSRGAAADAAAEAEAEAEAAAAEAAAAAGAAAAAEAGAGNGAGSDTVAGTVQPAPSGRARSAPVAAGSMSVTTPADCSGPNRRTIDGSSVMSASVLDSQWRVSEPPADATYDLTGVVSTAFPSTEHPFNTGTTTPGERTCIIGGELRGTIDPGRSWEYFHDEANAACVKVVALEWLQIHGTRCHGVEDGFRPQEGEPNSNRTSFRISGTYLSNIADDCLENDYILGGVLHDNLWESCFTGLSERPSRDREWTPPADETLTLDHMLIGLRSMPHDSDKGTGPNALFKWSTSANKVIIRCSVFMVPDHSVNGTDTMAIPAGTVVDDSACPNNPSTIVWLGGGNYPAPTAGIRVVSDRGVWDRAVSAWKSAHGVS